jgi:hypothetical protein
MRACGLIVAKKRVSRKGKGRRDFPLFSRGGRVERRNEVRMANETDCLSPLPRLLPHASIIASASSIPHSILHFRIALGSGGVHAFENRPFSAKQNLESD